MNKWFISIFYKIFLTLYQSCFYLLNLVFNASKITYEDLNFESMWFVTLEELNKFKNYIVAIKKN